MKFAKNWFVLAMVIGLMVAFTAPTWAEDAGKININTASETELSQLTQIGPKTAEGIVRYRKENGPFKNPEDLMSVKGIGPKIFEKNKARITVGEPLKDTKSDSKKSDSKKKG